MIEKTLSATEPFTGHVFRVEVLTVETPDGRQASREIVRHNGGACVLALDAEQRVYLVRQYRKPFDTWLLEVPAGKLEAGEDPLECAIRELAEETGLQADSLSCLATLYPSPGYCSEILTIYLATGLTQGEANPDDGEHLVCERYTLHEAMEMIDQGIIRDAKTQVALLTLYRRLAAAVQSGPRKD